MPQSLQAEKYPDKMASAGLKFWLSRTRRDDETSLPDDVFIALVTGLFGMIPSLLISVFAILLVAGNVALRNDQPLFRLFFAAAAVTGAARIANVIAFKRRGDLPLTKAEALRWEKRFAITAFLSMGVSGLLIFTALATTDNYPDIVLADCLGCGIAAGVTSRSAGRVWIATWQIVIVLVPIILGAFWRSESSFWVLGGLTVFFLFADLDITLRLNKQIVDLLLAQRALDRTAELEQLNHALRYAKAEAETANISKTRFLAAASHDLLQPLNAARLYATSLRELIDAGPAQSNHRSLSSNVECSLEAVEDILTALLDISQLDARATPVETTCFRLNDMFLQLKVEFAPSAMAKHLDLRFMPSSLLILSDARLLRRVLQNFISNAIKYTPAGRVIVGARREGRTARIEVWDTGIGIPKGKHRDIFREFERLPAAVTTAPGVGLGLSIVERIVDILNLKVAVHSTLGRGSVFSVTVPMGTRATTLHQATKDETCTPRGNLTGFIVAVIDNDALVLSGMAALLHGWDCRVFSGETSDDVEKTLRDAAVTPDVILADYHLDGDDGIKAVERLRRRFGNCQAALLTADRSPSVRDEALGLNIRVLNKPIKPAALRALLSQWHFEVQHSV